MRIPRQALSCDGDRISLGSGGNTRNSSVWPHISSRNRHRTSDLVRPKIFSKDPAFFDRRGRSTWSRTMEFGRLARTVIGSICLAATSSCNQGGQEERIPRPRSPAKVDGVGAQPSCHQSTVEDNQPTGHDAHLHEQDEAPSAQPSGLDCHCSASMQLFGAGEAGHHGHHDDEASKPSSTEPGKPDEAADYVRAQKRTGCVGHEKGFE